VKEGDKQMAETKYGKYINREPIEEGRFAPSVSFKGEKDAGIRFKVQYITEPFLMVDKAHRHDDIQLLCFYGGNPENVRDFGAEIELSLGKEGEKHIINTAAIVYIPSGLIHCPLNFKRVDKPIVMMGIYLASEYERKQP
jgi:hypothetical protein